MDESRMDECQDKRCSVYRPAPMRKSFDLKYLDYGQ